MDQYLTFLMLSIVLVISPGVDTALTTKVTLASGRRSGYFMVFGLCTGILVHTCAATLGLSAILMKSALAFSIVKYIGAFYLLYLGITAIWSTRRQKEHDSVDTAPTSSAVPSKMKGMSAYRQGLLSNVLNPKVAIFFLTFLPQFVVHGVDTAKQLFFMGISYAVLSIVWYLTYVYFINFLRKWLQSKDAQNWMERITGAVLIGFGLKLAFEKR